MPWKASTLKIVIFGIFFNTNISGRYILTIFSLFPYNNKADKVSAYEFRKTILHQFYNLSYNTTRKHTILDICRISGSNHWCHRHVSLYPQRLESTRPFVVYANSKQNIKAILYILCIRLCANVVECARDVQGPSPIRRCRRPI